MSKMTNCKACGKEVAKGAKACPNCGKDQRNFFGKHKILTGIVVIIVIIIAAVNAGGNSDSKPSTSTSSSNTNSSTKNTPKVDNKKYSLDKFTQVQMGMTYDQVKGILGDGKEESSTGDGEFKTISYIWKNSDGSNISVMLQGGKVTTKAQAFLQSMNAKATMDKYNKINNGMTYDQVKGILGEGQLMSQTELLGTKSEIYTWINSNGSNMNVTFQGGNVESKAQFELK